MYESTKLRLRNAHAVQNERLEDISKCTIKLSQKWVGGHIATLDNDLKSIQDKSSAIYILL